MNLKYVFAEIASGHDYSFILRRAILGPQNDHRKYHWFLQNYAAPGPLKMAGNSKLARIKFLKRTGAKPGACLQFAYCSK